MTTTDDRREDDDMTTTVVDDAATDTTADVAAETDESTAADAADDGAATVDDDAGDQEQPETFPREYVEKLRKESAGYRERAQRADQMEQRLHTSLVAATGRLADPTDLPFDVAHLDDADALTAAIDELIEAKPHLKTRRVMGDVGQGAGGVSPEKVDLAAILRARA